jgi:hypothetical protein
MGGTHAMMKMLAQIARILVADNYPYKTGCQDS